LLASRAYRASILQPFQTIDTGDAAEAPHLLSRHVQAADRVAELMAAQATPEELHASALLEVRDLTLIRNGAGIDSPSCAVEPQAEVCCGFETKPRGGSRDRLQPVWPYRFAGWTSVDIDDDPARNARFVLVRLWHDQEVVGPLFEGQPHEPPESTQVSRCVQAAGQELAATFPNATVTSLADPPGRLISRMWAYRTEYAHRAFLVDRGEGVFTVDAEHQSPIGGPLPQ
ncbi:MAG: hypothetical protein KDA24_16010, partial [Deltaproteobacteria bacterium]|nr:hypothetical protein [Deltaproteobacteria bacterium]